MTKIFLRAALISTAIAMPAFANMDHGDKSDMMEKHVSHMFKKIDTNGDGKISKAEHDAWANKMFTDADTNKDGYVTKDEMMAMKKKEWEEHKAMHPGMGGNDYNEGTEGGSVNGTTGSSMSGNGSAGEKGTGSPKQ